MNLVKNSNPINEEHAISLAFAEDHILVRKGVIALLEEFGEFTFSIEAENGEELIRKISQCNKLPDICILDINMKRMNGFDTLVEIKKLWPEMKVMILTMSDNEYNIMKMIASGADAYVLKNCNPEEIRKGLLSIYKQGFYNSDITSTHLVHAIKNKEVRYPNITAKEKELLEYICSDLTFEMIADRMNTTLRSVLGYRDSLFKKLNVHSRTTLAICAVQLGLIPLEINF